MNAALIHPVTPTSKLLTGAQAEVWPRANLYCVCVTLHLFAYQSLLIRRWLPWTDRRRRRWRRWSGKASRECWVFIHFYLIFSRSEPHRGLFPGGLPWRIILHRPCFWVGHVGEVSGQGDARLLHYTSPGRRSSWPTGGAVLTGSIQISFVFFLSCLGKQKSSKKYLLFFPSSYFFPIWWVTDHRRQSNK